MTIFTASQSQHERLRPTKAIVVHQSEDTSQQAVLTLHPIYHDSEIPRLSAGRLFTAFDEQCLFDILNNNFRQHQQVSFLPHNVLAITSTLLAWYVPPRVATMFFRFGKINRRLCVPWPSLIFKVSEGRLSVVAIKTRSRPTEKTRVFHAPLMNIYASTEVCTGNIRLPDSWTVDDMSAWETVIYDTYNTHTNHSATLRLTDRKSVDDQDHFHFWRDLAKQKASRFPGNVLVSKKLSIQQWLTH